MPDTITDADVRIQIEQYLAAGWAGEDFDVEAILVDVMEIIRGKGLAGIDGIDGEVFSRIVQRHGTSAPTVPAAVADRSPSETLIRDLYATIAFFTANPDLPMPWAVSMHMRVDDLAAVVAIAERFGRHEYGSSQEDGVPQADFDIPGCGGRINVIVHAKRAVQ